MVERYERGDVQSKDGDEVGGGLRVPEASPQALGMPHARAFPDPAAHSELSERERRYDRRMLAYLAAIVPIVASLYVCLSALSEYARQNHEARVFARLERRQSAEFGMLWGAGLSDQEITERQHRINERRRMLLEYNGLDPNLGTRGLFNQMGNPAPAARADVRRQWVLLIGSAAGVVLLALDAIGTP